MTKKALLRFFWEKKSTLSNKYLYISPIFDYLCIFLAEQKQSFGIWPSGFYEKQEFIINPEKYIFLELRSLIMIG